jgi:hypothetical protein
MLTVWLLLSKMGPLLLVLYGTTLGGWSTEGGALLMKGESKGPFLPFLWYLGALHIWAASWDRVTPKPSRTGVVAGIFGSRACARRRIVDPSQRRRRTLG